MYTQPSTQVVSPTDPLDTRLNHHEERMRYLYESECSTLGRVAVRLVATGRDSALPYLLTKETALRLHADRLEADMLNHEARALRAARRASAK